jgi:four helix bundle protein
MGRIARTFRDLDVWKLAIDVAKQTYALTSGLPVEERHGLSAQMRRAAVSMSANIAEGFRRQSPNEFRQFLLIALGSAAELESCCELCAQLFGESCAGVDPLVQQLDLFQRRTNTLRQRIQKRPSA